MPVPSLGELELRVRSGSAVAVIVEGEEVGDDAWIYGDIWFGSRAREIRFLPQDGWPRVLEAVTQLRSLVPEVPVFGIIDRDFSDDAQLDDLVPAGVYRSRLYSVENYLLDPDCWHEVFQLVMRRRGGLPPGWSNPAEIQARIEASYWRCLPAAAFNQVVAATCRANPTYPGAPEYIRNLLHGWLQDPAAVLRNWGQSVGHSQDLGAEFAQALADLQAAAPERLPCLVDGKMVLGSLLAEFQTVRGRSYQVEDYVNHYLDACPEPPPDAVALLDRILAAAQVFTTGSSPP
jgi:hypothetical protein